MQKNIFVNVEKNTNIDTMNNKKDFQNSPIINHLQNLQNSSSTNKLNMEPRNSEGSQNSGERKLSHESRDDVLAC